MEAITQKLNSLRVSTAVPLYPTLEDLEKSIAAFKAECEPKLDQLYGPDLDEYIEGYCESLQEYLPHLQHFGTDKVVELIKYSTNIKAKYRERIVSTGTTSIEKYRVDKSLIEVITETQYFDDRNETQVFVKIYELDLSGCNNHPILLNDFTEPLFESALELYKKAKARI